MFSYKIGIILRVNLGQLFDNFLGALVQSPSLVGSASEVSGLLPSPPVEPTKLRPRTSANG